MVISELSWWYKIEELWCWEVGEARSIRATRCGQNIFHLIHTSALRTSNAWWSLPLFSLPSKVISFSSYLCSLLKSILILFWWCLSILIQTTGYRYCLAVPPARSRLDLSASVSPCFPTFLGDFLTFSITFPNY